LSANVQSALPGNVSNAIVNLTEQLQQAILNTGSYQAIRPMLRVQLLNHYQRARPVTVRQGRFLACAPGIIIRQTNGERLAAIRNPVASPESFGRTSQYVTYNYFQSGAPPAWLLI